MQTPGFRHAPRDRGAIMPLAALVMTIIITATAFTVDLGRMRTERRDLQADADAIALDAVQAMEGLTTAAALAAAVDEANASAARNGLDVTLTTDEVEVGEWDVASQQLLATGADEYPDAVQVSLTSRVPMYFDFSADDRSVSRTAVAVARATTRGELGSVFSGIQSYDHTAGCEVRAALDAQMTFMNHLYTQYFEISVSGGVGVAADSGSVPCEVTGPDDGLQLDALSWQGLAFSKVNLDDVATRMGFASADELTNATVAAKDLMEASAQSMQDSGNATDVDAGTTLASFATHIAGDAQVAMDDVFGVAAGSPSPGAADAWVNGLDLVGLTAMAIDGNNFAAVSLPVSVGNVDPIITPKISIIEPPQRHLDPRRPGQPGPSTAQVKLGFDVPLTGVLVDMGVLGGVLGSLGVQTSDGSFSVIVEVARADSTYGEIVCPLEDEPTSAFEVETGAFTMNLGTVTDGMLRREEPFNLKSKSMLTATIGIPVTGPSIDLAATTDIDYSETYALGVSQQGRFDGDINVFGATESHTFTGPFDPQNPQDFYRYDGGISGTSITDDAYTSVDFNTTSSMLSLLGVADAAVHDLVNTAMEPVQQEMAEEVIDPLLAALGITVAGADGRIRDVNCQSAALANRDTH